MSQALVLENFIAHSSVPAHGLIAGALYKDARAMNQAERGVVAHERALTIDVTDDGVFAAAVAPGHGLRGMTERAGSLGGEVTAGPGPDGGWTVHAALPLT